MIPKITWFTVLPTFSLEFPMRGSGFGLPVYLLIIAPSSGSDPLLGDGLLHQILYLDAKLHLCSVLFHWWFWEPRVVEILLYN